MTTEDNKPEVVEFNCIDEAISHVEKLEKEAKSAMEKYRSAVYQFTGITPGQQIFPMDLVKLIMKFKDAK